MAQWDPVSLAAVICAVLAQCSLARYLPDQHHLMHLLLAFITLRKPVLLIPGHAPWQETVQN